MEDPRFAGGLDDINISKNNTVNQESNEKSVTNKPRHGSSEFYRMLHEMSITHDSKSHDYVSNDSPFANYHFAGQMAILFSHSPDDAGFWGRIAEKVYRLANLEKDAKIPNNETIEDTERDIAVIATLWMASRRTRRIKKLLDTKKEARQHQSSADISRFEQITNLMGQIQNPDYLQKLEHFTKQLRANLPTMNPVGSPVRPTD